MDFSGLGRYTAYKLNRPLSDQEVTSRLDRKRRQNFEARDELSLIKINSTYMELVDRWYAPKGWSVIFAIMMLVPLAYPAITVPLLAFERGGAAIWIVALGVVAIYGFCGWIAWYGFRLEAFRQTHYPIRLNRRTRRVHAYRPDGSILEADWDKLYFCRGESLIPAYGKTYDVRAHVMDRDRKTVIDTFTLMYSQFGGEEAVPSIWEYARRYMEEPNGVELNWRYSETCLPVVDRREGLWFGIVRPFSSLGAWPLLQLLLSPVWAVGVLGRWVAMYTSKVPKWPAEVEAQYVIESDDPYRRDWRDNAKLNFQDGVWPVICFAVGLVAVSWGVAELVAGATEALR